MRLSCNITVAVRKRHSHDVNRPVIVLLLQTRCGPGMSVTCLHDYAATLVHKAVLKELCVNQPLVLHADNGAIQKGSTLRAKLEFLGVTSSFSRPRVSNDNPYSESLFRTCKYCPMYPADGKLMRSY